MKKKWRREEEDKMKNMWNKEENKEEINKILLHIFLKDILNDI